MEFNYENTRKHTIGKLVVMSLSTLLPLLAIVLLGLIYDFFKGEQALDLKIFRYIVFIVFECAIISRIVLYIRIIVSKDWATAYYIKKRDERNVYIKQRTNSFTLKFVLFFEALGTIAAGFISAAVFYSIIAIIGVTLATYFFTYLYFSKKI